MKFSFFFEGIFVLNSFEYKLPYMGRVGWPNGFQATFSKSVAGTVHELLLSVRGALDTH